MRRLLMTALCGLLVVWPLVASAPAHATHEPWGSTSARDQKMHQGCHAYPFRYRITTPPGHWSSEIFLLGPKGGKVGSAGFMAGPDPVSGRSVWRLCRSGLVAGTYTMRMKVSYIDGYDLRTAWVKPSRFRITQR